MKRARAPAAWRHPQGSRESPACCTSSLASLAACRRLCGTQGCTLRATRQLRRRRCRERRTCPPGCRLRPGGSGFLCLPGADPVRAVAARTPRRGQGDGLLVALADGISSLHAVFEYAGLRVATGAVDMAALRTDGANAYFCCSSARYRWTEPTATEPSPAASATRLKDPCRMSPTANTPGRLVS